MTTGAATLATVIAATTADSRTAAAQRPSERPSERTAPAAPTFDELYRRGQAANKNIKKLTAHFVETTTKSLLERPIVERGLLYVERPSRVALHYTDPPDRRVVIDGKWMTTLWPSMKLNQRMNVGRAQEQVQKYFVGGDAGELRRIFDIELRPQSERRGTRELLMVPKQKRIRESLSRLELWVEDSSGLLHAMRMTFSSGDVKVMEFENVSPNAPVDPAVFVVPK
jgi:outer membrane lipoprotein-sorting protein